MLCAFVEIVLLLLLTIYYRATNTIVHEVAQNSRSPASAVRRIYRLHRDVRPYLPLLIQLAFRSITYMLLQNVHLKWVFERNRPKIFVITSCLGWNVDYRGVGWFLKFWALTFKNRTILQKLFSIYFFPKSLKMAI